MKIVIVGLGALGSHVALLIRNFKAKVTLVDFDRVEQKNLRSQFHTRMGNNRNKAQAVAQGMQGMWNTKMSPIPHKLTADNVEQILGGADLVVDCVDNGATRRLIQTYIRKHDIPCLHGALSADGVMGKSVWDQNFTVDDENVQGEATCGEGDFLPFISFVSSMLAMGIQEWMADGTQVSYNILGSGITVRY